jgi:DNA-directed RNA polymerase specialized sigma24 family protein
MISVQYRRNSNKWHSYATDDDFQQLFTTQINSLFRLSLQLTADAVKALHCLTLAKNDCRGTNTITQDFAHVWARRMVIRNAIDLVMGIDRDNASDAGPEFYLQPSEVEKEEQLESATVLHLPKFDRLAFVICVLERLSILDCALLLGKSPKDVKEAIVRATNRIGLHAAASHADSPRAHVVERASTVTTLDTRPREPQLNCPSFFKD